MKLYWGNGLRLKFNGQYRGRWSDVVVTPLPPPPPAPNLEAIAGGFRINSLANPPPPFTLNSIAGGFVIL